MISVVIPLYNKEKSIKNTIQCVLNQTFTDFEVVVVNDGSTDKSVEVVSSITDNRIRIINKENGGVSSARNRGIKEARYEWIAFLDADDLWEVNHLEVFCQMILKYPDIKVFCTTFQKSTDIEQLKSENDEILINNFFKESVQNGTVLWTSCSLIYKECFEECGFFDTKLAWGEDIDVWVRLARKYTMVKSLQQTAVYELYAENRAMRRNIPFEKNYASIIDLRAIKDKFELAYFLEYLIGTIKIYLYKKQLLQLIKLLIKHNRYLLKRV